MEQDCLIRGLHSGLNLRAVWAEATSLVNAGITTHDTDPAAAMAFSSALGAAGGGVTGAGRGLAAPPRPTGRLMRIVFIGAFSLLTGATPIASESEILAVLCFAASF